MKFILFTLSIALSFSNTSLAGSTELLRRSNVSKSVTKLLQPAPDWLIHEAQLSVLKIQQNIAPVGALPGVVIASPQTQNPNYYHHWTRDAAMTMDTIVELYRREGNKQQRTYYATLMQNYVAFSRQNQLSRTIAGLGEPIFEVNGDPFQGPWGRPQNDGPALRAIALAKWAHLLLDGGEETYVRTWLYTDGLPANTVVKADLEYVAHHWRESSFDLWEEVKGDHFFTRMVQRRALLAGAMLADRLKDPTAAGFYRQQAAALSAEIEKHWDSRRGLINPTLNWNTGADYKYSGIDIAVVLGVLYGQWDGFFSVTDQRVTATFEKIVKTFSQIYPVNQRPEVPGYALGRYPEDRYSGTDFNGGNPWVLATLAGAELMYDLGAIAARSPSSTNQALAKKLLDEGDTFVLRTQYHANPDGSLSEQIHRVSGFMISARDLTWNYAAVLRTTWAREQLIRNLRR
jgi:glucoamylase